MALSDKSTQLVIVVSHELLARLELHRVRLSKQLGEKPSRSAAARVLITEALNAHEPKSRPKKGVRV